MLKCYFAIRNEFLCYSSRIEPILPNIRDEILSESRLIRTPSRLEKFFLIKPHESPRINKKSIRGNSGNSWPVWNRGISRKSSAKLSDVSDVTLLRK